MNQRGKKAPPVTSRGSAITGHPLRRQHEQSWQFLLPRAPLLWDESPCRARCSTPQDRIMGMLSSSISPSSPPAPLSPPPLSCPLRAQGSVLGGSSAVWEERWQNLSHAQPALCRALLRQLTSPAASLPKCSSSPDQRFVSNFWDRISTQAA